MLISDLPRNKHYRYLETAAMAAFLCPGVGRNNFRLGSVLLYKKNILAVKNNSGKTHPKLLSFTKYPFIHSESNAILSVGMDNCAGATLYVVRLLANREIALAKPCASCLELIKYCHLKRIFYTTATGIEELVL